MEKRLSKYLSPVYVTLIMMLSNTSFAYDPKQVNQETQTEANQYVFAWSFSENAQMRPRGGISRGKNTVLDNSNNEQWDAIRDPGISKFEQDRRAILAMAGGYRTSFDFLETHIKQGHESHAKAMREPCESHAKAMRKPCENHAIQDARGRDEVIICFPPNFIYATTAT